MPAEVETMFYYGDVPWHSLGVQLDHIATAEEAIIAAGLQWNVSLNPVFVQTPNGLKLVDDRFAVMRTDRWETLGVVGKVYKPLQNEEAFKFFDSVVGEGQAIYHTAGSLREGRVIWILAKLPDTVVVKGTDLVDKYVLLSNSHDGSSGVKMAITPIRVVCQNTLNVALQAATKVANLRHCPANIERVTDVRQALGLVNEYYGQFGELANYLANVDMNSDKMNEYLDSIGMKVVEGETSTQAVNIRSRVEEIFNGATGTETLRATRFTLWSAFNSVVEYIDHERTTRTNGISSEKESRLYSQWFGSGAKLKQLALNSALRLAA